MKKYINDFDELALKLHKLRSTPHPKWLWDKIVEIYYTSNNDITRILNDTLDDIEHVWNEAYGAKGHSPVMIDDLDAWIKAFELYRPKDLKDESNVDYNIRKLLQHTYSMMRQFNHACDNYNRRKIARDDDMLGSIPFDHLSSNFIKGSTRFDDDMDVFFEPNTEIEDKIEHDLTLHYDGTASIIDKDDTIDTLEKLNATRVYGDIFSAPLDTYVYRGIAVYKHMLRSIFRGELPKTFDVGDVVNVSNVVVNPKEYSSWSTDRSVAKYFIKRQMRTFEQQKINDGLDFAGALYGLNLVAKIDTENASAFVVNPKLGSKFGYRSENETIQVKPVRIETIIFEFITDD